MLLYRLPSGLPIPVASMSLSASVKIANSAARVTISQTFKLPDAYFESIRRRNSDELPMEVVLSVSAPGNAAVCEFECEVEDRRIRGVVKEKEEARQEYNAAVESGQVAGLVEQHQPDVFQVSLGNLDIVTYVTYVQELGHDAEAEEIRFSLLSRSIPPRYGAPEPITTLSTATSLQAHASCSDTPTVQITLEMPNPILSIRSPSHSSMSFHLGTTSHAMSDEFNPNTAFITLDTESPDDMSKELVVIRHHPIRTELIVLVDRSGSMAGGKITQAAAALRLFLKSIPKGSYFNIVGFGSHHQWDREGWRWGFAEFVGENEKLKAKVVKMLKAAVLPPLTEYHIDWTDGWKEEEEEKKEEEDDFEMVGGEKKEIKPALSFFSVEKEPVAPVVEETPIAPRMVQQAPFIVPSLWPGARPTLSSTPRFPIPEIITITAKSSDGPITLTIPVIPTTEGTLLHTLAARKLIQDIDQNTSHLSSLYQGPVPTSLAKSETLKLALKYSLVSNFTAFIAVDPEKREKPTRTVKEVMVVTPTFYNGAFGFSSNSTPQPAMQSSYGGVQSQVIPQSSVFGGGITQTGPLFGFGAQSTLPGAHPTSGGVGIPFVKELRSYFSWGYVPSSKYYVPTSGSGFNTATSQGYIPSSKSYVPTSSSGFGSTAFGAAQPAPGMFSQNQYAKTSYVPTSPAYSSQQQSASTSFASAFAFGAAKPATGMFSQNQYAATSFSPASTAYDYQQQNASTSFASASGYDAPAFGAKPATGMFSQNQYATTSFASASAAYNSQPANESFGKPAELAFGAPEISFDSQPQLGSYASDSFDGSTFGAALPTSQGFSFAASTITPTSSSTPHTLQQPQTRFSISSPLSNMYLGPFTTFTMETLPLDDVEVVACAVAVVVLRRLEMLRGEWEMMVEKTVGVGVGRVGRERWEEVVRIVEKGVK
ncbi:hypothetical protein BC829DRAFT_434490 [Chytridium lagenaria]|nr:hypothetical protein BC829DRAFT_434490 [Chytridium lagenaria]